MTNIAAVIVDLDNTKGQLKLAEKEITGLKAKNDVLNRENLVFRRDIRKAETKLCDFVEDIEQQQSSIQELAFVVDELGHYFKQHDEHPYRSDKLIALAKQHLKGK